MPKQSVRDLAGAEGYVSLANGSPIEIERTVLLRLSIADKVIDTPALVVSGVKYQLVLGSDFCRDNSCVIDYKTAVFSVQDTAIPFRWQAERPIVCRILATRSSTIPPGHQAVLSARLESKGRRNRGCVGLTENLGANDLAAGRWLAKALVIPNSGSRLPTRLINITEEPVRIRQGCTLGWFCPLESTEPLNTIKLLAVESGDDPQEEPKFQGSDSPSEADLLPNSYGDCGLSTKEDEEFRILVRSYGDVFTTKQTSSKLTTVVEHEINTENARPIKIPPRRLPPHLQPEVDRQVNELLEKGQIEEAQSPWCFPLVCVKKKSGEMRMCVDYRKLNEVTVKDAVPMPRVDDALEAVHGAKIFSTMDLHSGFWQVGVRPQDQDKTAFAVPHRGQFRWKVMPFGLVNSPATFTRLMAAVLDKQMWKTCLVYIDDLLVWSTDVDEHLRRLEEIFSKLRQANLCLKPQKCHFLQKQVKFLGHTLSAAGISTDEEKVQEVKNWPTPRSSTELHSFLGLCGYYRKFIKDFAAIAAPLTRLTTKDAKFEWKTEQQLAFETLKERMTSSEVMAHPDFSPDAGEFILDTDGSSKMGIGAVLSQVQPDGAERVIAYGSKTLNQAERNYCTTRLELLAVVTFIMKFRYYLLGKAFCLRTDHSSLQWLKNFSDAEGQVARWLEKLAPFQYRIVHRPGRSHGNADAMSRKPVRRHFGAETCPACAQHPEGLNAVEFERFSAGNLASEQDQDDDLRTVKEALGSNLFPDKSETAWSPLARAVWTRKDDLVLQENVLLVRNKDRRDEYQMVLPRKALDRILKTLHEGVGGGHMGFAKTKFKVLQRYWRPGLSRAIEEYIRGCATCCKSKPGKRNRAPLQPLTFAAPFDCVMMDIVGPLPRSKAGNIYLLTVQDSFTKWPDAYPLRNQKARTVARALFNRWISQHGCPSTLHSDQGRNFESQVMREMCRILEIRKSRTTAYHPSGNGQVENFNKSLKSILKCCLEDSGRNDWEEFVSSALMAYRSSVHRATGYTPHYMVYGTEMRLPIDLTDQPPQPVDSHVNFVKELEDKLQTAHRAARQQLNTYQRRQKDQYDKRTRGSDIQEGDHVFVYSPALKPDEAAKFHVSWLGPVKVLERRSEVLFKVENPSNRKKSKFVHFNNLRKFARPAALETPVRTAAPPEVVDETDSETEAECETWTRPQLMPPQDAEEVAEVLEEQMELVDDPQPTHNPVEAAPEPRRSGRLRRPPDRYGQPVTF
ncbi:hypothetical protein BOX15_Mlig019225g1 [Macrostomum lignano]|uniref:RNA-directed DNA polymerase n=1 Tax=Macrostomum lignano TaxID=282301 RepID=A0A267E582_9PLAT|nr:hypothetical protein BOX15_Mlig019225g1 [Macrostomum lignano]